MLWNIILMHYGLGLENLVKGLLIAQGTKPFVTKHQEKMIAQSDFEVAVGIINGTIERKFNPILNHNLNGLFERACLDCTTDDRELLDLLEDAVESGKYPINKSANNRQTDFSVSRKHNQVETRQHIMQLLKIVDDKLRNSNTKRFQFGDPIEFETLGIEVK